MALSFNGCSFINKDKSIVIWCHLGDEETAAVRKTADTWGKQNGFNVKVLSDRGDTRAYIEAEKAGKGPDVEFGIPYSKLNLLNQNGLLAPISQYVDESKYIKTALNSVSLNGKIVALPINFSTYALYYNTKKILTPPKTLQELIELSIKYGFEYDVNDVYLSYSFIASQGGYIYKYKNGSYDTKDIGINSSDSVKGYALLQDFVNKYKIMPKDIDGIKARNDFISGKTAFYFNGPGDIELINQSKVDFSVCAMPKVNGVNLPTFISTDSAFISSNSTKKQEAFQLLSFLIDETQIPLFKINGRLPITINASMDSIITKNSKLKAFVEQGGQNGVLIPDANYIQSLQKSRTIFEDLTSGKIPPAQCGVKLLYDLKQSIKKLK